MVLILYSSSEHDAHTWIKLGIFGQKKIRFVTVLDVIECLKQVKHQGLIHTCAPISELPSKISTMPKIQHVQEVLSLGVPAARSPIIPASYPQTKGKTTTNLTLIVVGIITFEDRGQTAHKQRRYTERQI